MTTKLKEVQKELEMLREKDRSKIANYKKLDMALKENMENNKHLQKDVEVNCIFKINVEILTFIVSIIITTFIFFARMKKIFFKDSLSFICK